MATTTRSKKKRQLQHKLDERDSRKFFSALIVSVLVLLVLLYFIFVRS